MGLNKLGRANTSVFEFALAKNQNVKKNVFNCWIGSYEEGLEQFAESVVI